MTKSASSKTTANHRANPTPRSAPPARNTKGALKIGVIGCAGRMGQMLIRAASANERCLVVGGVERSGASMIGRDVGALAGIEPLGVPVGDNAGDLFDAGRCGSGIHQPGGHAAACGAGGEAAQGPCDRHHRTGCGADHHIAAPRQAHGHRHGAQHEPGGESPAAAGDPGGAFPGYRLGYRDRGDASPGQGRCALGHGAGAGQGGRRRAGSIARPRCRAGAGTA